MKEELFHTERGEGPPVLLVHGAMVSGAMFESLTDRLAMRHRVIVPDLRGHGRSRHLPPPFTVAQLAADLAQLLDCLGVPSVAVLGYSQGGAIAQQLALDHPARCERLLLACTYAFNRATLRERMEGALTLALLRLLGMRRFARLVVSAGLEETGDWLVELIADQDPSLMAAAWREALAFDSRSRLAQIGCPTLIITGARDNAVPMHHAAELERGIPGAQLSVMDHAGHGLVWTHTDTLARLVEAFLSGER